MKLFIRMLYYRDRVTKDEVFECFVYGAVPLVQNTFEYINTVCS